MEQKKETSNSNQNTSPEKEKYIWFGVYNELLLNENISKLFNKLVDKSLPKESAAIHLNKFSISFIFSALVLISLLFIYFYFFLFFFIFLFFFFFFLILPFFIIYLNRCCLFNVL